MASDDAQPEDESTLVELLRGLRRHLPGDSLFGDRLSVAGGPGPTRMGRRIAEIAGERPSVLREAGLGALQVWQAVAEAQGHGRGDEEWAILFTDLVGFSDWAMQAGDDAAVELLREVGDAIEPVVDEHDGEVVKRLGDGLMAVFERPRAALEAAWDAQRAVARIEVGDYDPRVRAGVHVGRPRKLGGDYIGVDVNIAARVADCADGESVTISTAVLDRVDHDALRVTGRRDIDTKGVPEGVQCLTAEPAG